MEKELKMGFEKVTLDSAKEVGIEGAYFYEGTMFIPSEGVTEEALEKFKEEIFGKIIVSNAGDEVAIDFV